MKKLFILFIISFLFLNNLSAQESSEGIKTWLEEEDGSPSIIVYKTKVSNNTLTDNLDGTASLTTAGGWTDDGTTVRLTSSGDNVGIGRSNPSAKLHIFGAGTATGFALMVSDTTPTDRLAVLDNGNVGIGTTGPNTKLEVNGIARFTTGSGGTFSIGGDAGINRIQAQASAPTIQLLSTSNTYANLGIGSLSVGGTYGNIAASNGAIIEGNLGIGTTTPVALLQAGTSPNPGLIVQANGNTGIGTTSPYGLLQVGTHPTNPGLIVTTGNNVGIGTTNPSIGKLQVAGRGWFAVGSEADPASFDIVSGGTNVVAIGTNRVANTVTDLQINTLSASGVVNMMRLTSTGNVGIGTTNPVALLQVGTSPNAPLVVLANGNVGIGTTNPVNTLTVGSGINAGAAGNALGVKGAVTIQDDSGLLLRNTGWTKTLSLGQSSSVGTIQGDGGININGDIVANGVLTLQGTTNGTRTTSYVNIQPNGGNVGIGTTAPVALLQVGTSPNAPLVVLANGNVGIGNTAPITLLQVGTSPNVGLMVTSAGNVGVGTSLPIGLLQVGTSPGTAALTVTGGNIGVGKTNPTAKIYIFAATTAPTATLAIIGSGTGAGLTGGIVLKASNGTCGYGTLADGTGPLNWLSVTCP